MWGFGTAGQGLCYGVVGGGVEAKKRQIGQNSDYFE